MNYIQLISQIGNHKNPVTFYLPDNTSNEYSILTPWFDYSAITRDFIKHLNLNFGDLIRNAILHKNYVFLYVNEKYIPETAWNTKGMDYNYQILLHGYDETTNKVSIFTYDSNRRLNTRTIHITELEKSYFDNNYKDEKNENKIFFIKLRDKIGFDLNFNLEYIIAQLVHYRDEKSIMYSVLDQNSNYRYGLAVYESVIENFTYALKEHDKEVRYTLITPIHLLMEHKKIMLGRLRYIEEQHPNLDLSSYISEFSDLKDSLLILRNYALKYEMTYNPRIIDKSIAAIKDIKDREKNLLTLLINDLSESNIKKGRVI
ncbi:hypothetical protein [Paenibacillus pabuli]|nr:hypothetical protein [Paenibacillus pabuli]